MKIAQLFAPFRGFKFGDAAEKDVLDISFDSRTVKPGAIYVAVRGQSADGHKFLNQACSAGAIAVVVEDESAVPTSYSGAVVRVDDTRRALFQLAHDYYGRPTEDLAIVGVTGTNGKTSVTYMTESVLSHFGMPTGVIGTIDHHIGTRRWESSLTTPDAVMLNRRLRDFNSLGARAVAMEVSSHAIDQGRASGIPFDVVVFTNLTRDHLDYHKTMDNYFAAKQRLFREIPSGHPSRPTTAVINVSDPWGGKLETASHIHRWTYGESRSDFQFQIMSMDFGGTRIRLQTPRGNSEARLAVIGRHNAYNAVASMATGMALGASLNTVTEAMEKFAGVPGRLQKIAAGGLNVFVDYAHTDDALLSVLSTLHHIREHSRSKNRIITVFGCGGDRDRGKRPLMAKVASELSDLVVVTSDNPRTESPIAVVNDVLNGVSNSLMNRKVFVEVDRREAIRRALSMAEAGDAVLVAGKGHEDYQVIGTRKSPFSDVEVVKGILNVL